MRFDEQLLQSAHGFLSGWIDSLCACNWAQLLWNTSRMFAAAIAWILKESLAKGPKVEAGWMDLHLSAPQHIHVDTVACLAAYTNLISTCRHVPVCHVMHVQWNVKYIRKRFAIQKKSIWKMFVHSNFWICNILDLHFWIPCWILCVALSTTFNYCMSLRFRRLLMISFQKKNAFFFTICRRYHTFSRWGFAFGRQPDPLSVNFIFKLLCKRSQPHCHCGTKKHYFFLNPVFLVRMPGNPFWFSSTCSRYHLCALSKLALVLVASSEQIFQQHDSLLHVSIGLFLPKGLP